MPETVFPLVNRKGTASFLLPGATAVTSGDGLTGFLFSGFGGATPLMEQRADSMLIWQLIFITQRW